jgi:hypothetical protein
MKARGTLLASAMTFLLLIGADAAISSIQKRSPTQLYRALRTTPFAPATVHGRFGSAARSVVAPSASARRHHAIGTVRITFGRGQGTIDYTVFRSHRAPSTLGMTT